MKVDPETGNLHIPAMAAKGTSARTTFVEFAWNGDSHGGRNQRDMGVHHVAVEVEQANTDAGKKLLRQASDDLASTMLLTNFTDCDPSATAKPWRTFSDAVRSIHAGRRAVVLA